MKEIKLQFPEKIDRRHIYGIILDTETANTLVDENDELDMSSVLFYDLGFKVIDSHGRDYGQKFSFVNADIFLGENELMKSAYYANKIPKYWEDIKAGNRILTSTYRIQQILKQISEYYNCQFVVAHNARFDYKSLNNTIRYITKSKYRYFLPKNLVWYDTLKMARHTIGKMKTYRDFCVENGYITKNNQLKFTAEILFRFITRNNDFIESHTGLEDVEIESEIFKYCYNTHKKMDKKLWKD